MRTQSLQIKPFSLPDVQAQRNRNRLADMAVQYRQDQHELHPQIMREGALANEQKQLEVGALKKSLANQEMLREGKRIKNALTGMLARPDIATNPAIYSEYINSLQRFNVDTKHFPQQFDPQWAQDTLAITTQLLGRAPAKAAKPSWGINPKTGKEEQFYLDQDNAPVFTGVEKYHRPLAAGEGGKDTAKVATFKYYQTLSDADKAAFTNILRADKTLDIGDRFVRLHPVTKELIEVASKELTPAQEPAYQETVAKVKKTGAAEGEAQAGLPQAEQSAKYMIDLLTSVKDHPQLSNVVGMPGSISGAYAAVTGDGIRGTPERGFTSLLDQIKGKQFLNAFQSLKGGGHITEIEGQKATEAEARMDAAQTEEDFKSAVNEYIAIVQKGLEVARQKAKVANGGDVEDLLNKYAPKGN